MRQTLEHRQPDAGRAEKIRVLARLIDAAGCLVRPRDVAVIRYSLYALNSTRSANRRGIAVRKDAAADVDDVMFDSLQTDERWTLDATGYNFLHEIDVSGLGLSEHYELRYAMRPTFNPTSTIRLIFRSHPS